MIPNNISRLTLQLNLDDAPFSAIIPLSEESDQKNLEIAVNCTGQMCFSDLQNVVQKKLVCFH